MTFSWTDERVELLKKLWAGGMSATKIADELGATSRNSVIGKVHRLKLESRYVKPQAAPPPAKLPKPPKPGPIALNGHVGYASMTRNPIVPSLPPQRVEDKDIPIDQRCTLMDLDDSPWNPQKCRWPLGTPGKEGFAFCGGKVSQRDWGSKFKPTRCPYCDEHADRATGKSKAA